MKTVVMLTKVFFEGHPRAGQTTNFADSVRAGKKIHTCRDNAGYWTKKIEILKATGGTLSVREWQDKPYRSPQVVIAGYPATEVGTSELTMTRYQHRVEPYRHSITCYRATVDGKPVEIEELAKNDGFTSAQDFTAFIDPLFDKYHSDTITLAIIHFNNYRYQ